MDPVRMGAGDHSHAGKAGVTLHKSSPKVARGHIRPPAGRRPVRMPYGRSLQTCSPLGYLAREKTPNPKNPLGPYRGTSLIRKHPSSLGALAPGHSPTIRSYGVAVSSKRGNPVGIGRR